MKGFPIAQARATLADDREDEVDPRFTPTLHRIVTRWPTSSDANVPGQVMGDRAEFECQPIQTVAAMREHARRVLPDHIFKRAGRFSAHTTHEGEGDRRQLVRIIVAHCCLCPHCGKDLTDYPEAPEYEIATSAPTSKDAAHAQLPKSRR